MTRSSQTKPLRGKCAHLKKQLDNISDPHKHTCNTRTHSERSSGWVVDSDVPTMTVTMIEEIEVIGGWLSVSVAGEIQQPTKSQPTKLDQRVEPEWLWGGRMFMGTPDPLDLGTQRIKVK